MSSASDEEESVPAAAAIEEAPPESAAPVGPSADEEAAFLAEQGEGFAPGSAPTALAGSSEAPVADAPLPPMEDLVQRIPAEARELIEELFRARFVTVKRLPQTALKKN